MPSRAAFARSAVCAPPAGRRLTLREFTSADRTPLARLHADARVQALLIDPTPLAQPVVAQALIERLQRHYREHEGLGIWCAEHWASALHANALADPALREALSDAALADLARPRPRFAGWFSLMPVPGAPGEVEIGCCLAPGHWGSGLVHDGGELLLDHAFGALGLPRVWGVCHPQHRPVHFVLRSLGFVFDGPRPHDGVAAHWFRVDASQWQRQRALPRRARARLALG